MIISFYLKHMTQTVYYRTGIDNVVDIFKLTAANRNKKGKFEQTLNGCTEENINIRSFSLNNYMYTIESKITKSSGLPIGLVQVWFDKSGNTYICISTGSMTRFETYHNFTVDIDSIQITDSMGRVDSKVYKCLVPVNSFKVNATRDGQTFKNWKFVYESAKTELSTDILNQVEKSGLKLHDNSKKGCVIL
jgi:hypothetical protein